MTPDSDHSAAKEKDQLAAWMQTRAVLRIIIILLAVAMFLWIVYKLTTVLLLIVLSIFFAYLVAPLVDLVQRPIRLGGRERVIHRGLAIGIVYAVLFVGIGLAIYFLAPQLGAQFPEFKLQATAYYKTITNASDRLNGYFMQHRMPEGIVKAVNNTFLGLIAKGGELVSVAFERLLGLIIYIPWLVLIPILSFFFLKDADSFRRSVLAMLPRGRLRWRGDEFFQDVNSTLAAYIRAQLTACLLIAGFCSVGFARSAQPARARTDCRHARVCALDRPAGRGNPGDLAGTAAFRIWPCIRGPDLPGCAANHSGLCDLSSTNRARNPLASAGGHFGNPGWGRDRRCRGNLSGHPGDCDYHRQLSSLAGTSRQRNYRLGPGGGGR